MEYEAINGHFPVPELGVLQPRFIRYAPGVQLDAEALPSLLANQAAELAQQALKKDATVYRLDRADTFTTRYVEPGVEHMHRQQMIREMVDAGYLPDMDNGFSFVFDRRPPGKEDEYISAVEYTRYFSQGTVPIAEKDHKLHRHDVGHISSYQTMFGVARFASLVRTAATNALADPSNPQLCETFTKAMDSFGDSMRNLESGIRETSAINGAKRWLWDLISLERHSGDLAGRLSLYDTLYQALGLDYYEDEVKKMGSGYLEHAHRQNVPLDPNDPRWL